MGCRRFWTGQGCSPSNVLFGTPFNRWFTIQSHAGRVWASPFRSCERFVRPCNHKNAKRYSIGNSCNCRSHHTISQHFSTSFLWSAVKYEDVEDAKRQSLSTLCPQLYLQFPKSVHRQLVQAAFETQFHSRKIKTITFRW